MSKNTMRTENVTAVIGGQWGDEGKGKLIDILASRNDIIVRATGGANAGHTVYTADPVNPGQTKKYVFHLMPSGVLYPNTINVVGNGCVMHLPTFFEEVAVLKEQNINIDGRVFISDRVHLVFEYHKIIDKLLEERKGKGKVGTTGRGIGPAYTEKMARSGIRLHELNDLDTFIIHMKTNIELLEKMYNFKFDLDSEIEYYRRMQNEIRPFIKDTAFFLNNSIDEGKKVLIEGANGTLLDIDHGTYPYVTSSNASIGGIVSGTGVSATRIGSAIGIMKAYCTRVGGGPFPTELNDAIGEGIRTKGGEFGATTGRPRRCGWFDAVASKYSTMINGLTGINLTKLDILSGMETIKIATRYVYHGKELNTFPASAEELAEVEPIYEEMPGWKEDISSVRKISKLPKNALNYVNKIEELLGCPIEYVGVGVSRDQMAVK